MKMLFFSADRLEVEAVSKAFCDAGIACETRDCEPCSALLPEPGEAELWIQHDRDAHRALLLCVEQGIGFARRSQNSDRTVRYPSWDLDESVKSDAEKQEKQGVER